MDNDIDLHTILHVGEKEETELGGLLVTLLEEYPDGFEAPSATSHFKSIYGGWPGWPPREVSRDETEALFHRKGSFWYQLADLGYLKFTDKERTIPDGRTTIIYTVNEDKLEGYVPHPTESLSEYASRISLIDSVGLLIDAYNSFRGQPKGDKSRNVPHTSIVRNSAFLLFMGEMEERSTEEYIRHGGIYLKRLKQQFKI